MSKPRIIVSLTSWKKRIDTVDVVIKCLKKQTIKPDKIILYLAVSEFKNKKLPKKITSLIDDKFEICWTSDIKSYKKLIPALDDFPNDIIITVDDDIKYDKQLVESLVDGYKKYPKCIQARRVTAISYLGNKRIKTIVEAGNIFGEKSILYKFTGVGGVLYPPHCFDKRVMDENLFMSLAPTGDDIWFWVHAILCGHGVNLINGFERLNYIDGTQEVGLCRKNDVGGESRPFLVQFKQVINHYPFIKLKLFISTIIAKIKYRKYI